MTWVLRVGAALLLLMGFFIFGVGDALCGGPSEHPAAAKLAKEETKVIVGANVHVSKARAEFPHHEVILAADPKRNVRTLVRVINMQLHLPIHPEELLS
jgi:hypothetical protein